jgi:uncharacterized protein (TIGR02118 family)
MAKVIVLYQKPADPAHFDTHFRTVHMPLVEKMPGLRGYAFGPASGLDGAPAGFFWCFIGTFDSREAILAAFGTPEGEAVVADIPNYSPTGPTILYLEDTTG